jgi:hypothetical protein
VIHSGSVCISVKIHGIAFVMCPHCAANNTRIMKAGIKVLCLDSVVVPRKSLPASIHLSREVAQQRVHSNHLPPYMHTIRHRRESQIDRHDFPIFLKLLKPPRTFPNTLSIPGCNYMAFPLLKNGFNALLCIPCKSCSTVANVLSGIPNCLVNRGHLSLVFIPPAHNSS